MSISTKISSAVLNRKLIPFPYIQLTGAITRESTLFVSNMLKKIPKGSLKLGVVINSYSGTLAQAHIINKQINIATKQKGIELHTFIEGSAMNAGLLVAMNGEKVYADTTSIIGGLEVQSSKFTIQNELIERVTYLNEPSYNSEHTTFDQMNPAKKAEILKVYQEFSAKLEQEIRQLRKGKIPEEFNLANIYMANQAKENGLIDEIGRIHEIVNVEREVTKRLSESMFERIKSDMRKLNVW